jgi:hypothetical protein
MDATSRYTNTRGAAEHLACSASYLEKCRVTGGSPRFLKIGKAVRYKIEELDAFASAREHGSTSEYARGIPTAGRTEGTNNGGR